MITIKIDDYEFRQDVGNAILTWFEYKRERGQKYRGIGRKMLLRRLYYDVQNYGERYVVKEINHSIENNYMGIYPPPAKKDDGIIKHGEDLSYFENWKDVKPEDL